MPFAHAHHADPDAAPGAARRAGEGLRGGCLIQLYVFDGDEYLGWDCFEKDTVLVGGGADADLPLDDPALEAAWAAVHFDGTRVVVHDPLEAGLVRVNGAPVRTRILGSLDVVSVSRFRLKIRVRHVRGAPPRAAAGAPASPAPAGKRRSCRPPAVAVPGCGTRPPAIPAPVPASGRPRLPAPEPCPADSPEAVPVEAVEVVELGPEDAAEWFATDGVLDQFEELLGEALGDCDPDPEAVFDSAPAAVADGDAATRGEAVRVAPRTRPAAEPAAAGEPLGAASAGGQEGDFRPAADRSWLGDPEVGTAPDDDEEDEPDLEASFRLRDRLEMAGQPAAAPAERDEWLEVIHYRGSTVADVRFLAPGQAFLRPGGGRLAARDRDGTCQFFCGNDLTGSVTLGDRVQIATTTLCTPANLVDPRRGLYRAAVPEHGRVVLSRGADTFVLRRVAHGPAPAVPEPSRPRGWVLRNLVASVLVHLVLLGGGAVWLPGPPQQHVAEPQSRFVQIDTEQVADLVAPRPEPALERQPKPTPPPPPVKVEPAKQQPALATNVAPEPTPSEPPSQPLPSAGGSPAGADDAVAAASPEAGGGHGGNALNRDVKQTGILGALGLPDGIGIGAKEAMAAVTNLDAVASPAADEAALQVGGLVGKLGSSKIALPDVGLVNTRGSTQVIVSAGAEGEGRVAALTRGRTGKGRVRALVTADAVLPTAVQGGMSREEVKRVIDRHMDEVTYCYETALIEDPAIAGKLTFEWKILHDGGVGEVSIQTSSIRSDALHGCIKRAIRSWQFPRPRGAEVLVSYPFIFDVVGF